MQARHEAGVTLPLTAWAGLHTESGVPALLQQAAARPILISVAIGGSISASSTAPMVLLSTTSEDLFLPRSRVTQHARSIRTNQGWLVPHQRRHPWVS